MISAGSDSKAFEEVARELLGQGRSVRFQARGASMSPAICDGEIVEVTPVIVRELRKDDIVLAKSNHGFRLHRIVRADCESDIFITRGDCGLQDDPPLSGKQILGVARAKEVKLGHTNVRANFKGIGGWMLRRAARGQALAGKLMSRVTLRRDGTPRFRRTTSSLLLILFLMALATFSRGQVAVDFTTSGAAELTGSGTQPINLTHNTTAASNRLLIVSVSMNISKSTAAVVSNVTYNGTGLTPLGAHNDAGSTRRVEMWYLLNPASGNGIPIVVSVNIPTHKTVGVVAASTTFTGVDQTVPLGTFVSADGATGGNSQLDVPSVVNGMVLDTLATGGDQTVTIPAWQTSEWNASSGGTDPPDVTGTGSTRPGNPSLPFSETFSGTSNWSLGAVSI